MLEPFLNHFNDSVVVPLEEEAAFFEFMFFLQKDDGEGGEKSRGILAASRGYREPDGRVVVMEGPLKGREYLIRKINSHERKAYLNVEINGRAARCGFEDLGKRHWFPDAKETVRLLSDGTEVEIDSITDNMMGASLK